MKFLQTVLILFGLSKLSSGAYIFGWMLHNPIPDDLTLAEDNQNESFNKTHIKCSEDSDCHKQTDMYCDLHYGTCDYLHDQGMLCRRDSQCRKGLICMFGKCDNPSKPGQKGSRCSDDNDCKSGLCCARQHGEKVCKLKLQKGHRCYVPKGGLHYSLNEMCPCDTGLQCQKLKSKHKRKGRHSQSDNESNYRCYQQNI